MFESPDFHDHEQVSMFSDARTGLRGIIAIHSTALGPSAGGCRVWNYPDTQAALTDALRLSRGMSYKNAVAGLPLGGGKAVLLRNGDAPLTDAQFEAFGEILQEHGGRYVTAEDVGVSERNMVSIARRTTFVTGLPRKGGSQGVGGDPSPHTATGVFLGLRAAVRARFGRSDFSGMTVAVQGLGAVGRNLCMHLAEAGAKLLVADIVPQATESARERFGATIVPVNEILFQDVDILAPCALGAGLDQTTIPKIRAKIVGGAANNQLRTEQDGQRVFDAGILYAPDYVINAGGIISVGLEYLKETNAEVVKSSVAEIETRLDAIFEQSKRTKTPTHRIADAMARELIANGKHGRRSAV